MKKILLLLITLLIPSGHADAKDPVVARVNGKTIRQSEVYSRLWEAHGPLTLERLIELKLITQESQKRNITADPKQVEGRIEQIRAQLPAGTTFEERLQETGVSLKGLKEDIGFDIVRDRLIIQMAGIHISSSQIRGTFEANKDKLGTPETFKLSHILVKSDAEARDLRVALRAGANFAKLAEVKSIDTLTAKRGGSLGAISRGMLLPEIEKIITELKVGEVSDVVQTPQGFHIFWLQEKTPALPAKFEDVQQEIHQALIRKQIQQAYPIVLKKLKEEAQIKKFSRPGTPLPSAKE